MNLESTMRRNIYAGLFIVTLATLMYEILLTRIFSVTMFYHFSFFAVSVVMFGMTVGAILVYLFPDYFTQERATYHLVLSSLLFAICIPFSFLTHLNIPFAIHRSIMGIVGLYSIAFNYLVISIPFIFSGICVCVALTKFPQHVSKLYAADLMGTAFGCLLLISTLRVTDGPTGVIVVAFLASIGAVFFASGKNFHNLIRIALIVSFLLGVFAIVNTVLSNKQRPLLRLIWVKGKVWGRPLYEKWNSFSRIEVRGNPNGLAEPFGWGLSEKIHKSSLRIKQLWLSIDSDASTVITAYDGNLNNLEYLKYDVTNLVHYIRPDSNVFVIGTGGGRDVLSALVFNQKSVLGVEINENIIRAVNQKYGDFTGHLDRNPRVTFINDEARSYITRQIAKFDIIQSSLTDSWAATAAGAFVLAENTLYTVEAWKVFWKHLTPTGVLTFTRWYNPKAPDEAYRLVSLASTSLMELGVHNPRGYIVVVRSKYVATILVCKTPFSDKDLDTIESVSSRMQFEIILSPRFSLDSTFEKIASGKNLSSFMERFPVNIKAPTDDIPFFFNMVRFRNMFNRRIWNRGGQRKNTRAYFILGILLITVIGLSFLCIIVPLILKTKKKIPKDAWSPLIFFAAIGFGFMFVEMSQMQRLIIFLGHPTYGLSVVLFTLLLSSGFGSYLTQKINNPSNLKSSGIIRLTLLILTLFIFGIFTPLTLSMFRGFPTTIRILVAIATLFPLGMFMGMAFPLGMKMASIKFSFLTPWFWGVNGATSICASVIAVVISLGFGISATFWSSILCYIIAFIAFVWIS
ncbi:MAG: hypothetical protein ACETVT_00545 [bacterium]